MREKAWEFALKKSWFYPELLLVSMADAAREQQLHIRLLLFALKSVQEHFAFALCCCPARMDNLCMRPFRLQGSSTNPVSVGSGSNPGWDGKLKRPHHVLPTSGAPSLGAAIKQGPTTGQQGSLLRFPHSSTCLCQRSWEFIHGTLQTPTDTWVQELEVQICSTAKLLFIYATESQAMFI